MTTPLTQLLPTPPPGPAVAEGATSARMHGGLPLPTCNSAGGLLHMVSTPQQGGFGLWEEALQEELASETMQKNKDLEFQNLVHSEADVHRSQSRLLRELATTFRAELRGLACEVSGLKRSRAELQERLGSLEEATTESLAGINSGVGALWQRSEHLESTVRERLGCSSDFKSTTETVDRMEAELTDCCRRSEMAALHNDLWLLREGLLRESELREESLRRERAQAMSMQDLLAQERKDNGRRDQELRGVMSDLKVLCVALEGEVQGEVESRLRETRRLWSILSSKTGGEEPTPQGFPSSGNSAAASAAGATAAAAAAAARCNSTSPRVSPRNSPRSVARGGSGHPNDGRVFEPPVAVAARSKTGRAGNGSTATLV